MTREIKFRAWDTENRCFFEPTYEAYRGNLEELNIGMSGRLALRKIDGFFDESRFEGRFILMQYTGLKDKNGKEIYEGDVVNIDGSPVAVEWYNGAWTVEYFTSPKRSYLSIFDETDVEVIGNTYSNPELITPKDV